MKQILPILASILLLPSSLAQTLEWSTLISGNHKDFVTGGIAEDQFGGIYIAGLLTSGGSIQGNSVGVAGYNDAFLAKFNSAGEFQWSARGGHAPIGTSGQNDDRALAIVVDTNQHAVYYCGAFGTNSSFTGGHYISGRGGFLGRFDYNGNCMWMRFSNHARFISIALTNEGDLLVTSDSLASLAADSVIFFGEPDITLPKGPAVVKYSSDGELIWGRSMGMKHTGWVHFRNDTVYYVGCSALTSQADLLGTAFPANTENAMVLAAMDTTCTTVYWRRDLNATEFIYKRSGFVNENGYTFCGVYRGSLYLPEDTIIATVTTPLIMRFGPQGSLIKVFDIHMGPNGHSFGGNVVPTVQNELIVTLDHLNALNVSGHAFNTANTMTRGIVLLKLSDDGEVLGYLHAGPTSSSVPISHRTLDGGIIFTTTTGFTQFTLSNNIPVNGGQDDILLAKINLPTSIAPKFNNSGQLLIYANPNAGTCTIELPQELTRERDLWLRIYDSSGNLVQQSRLAVEQDLIKLDITAQARGSYLAEVGNGRVKYSGMIIFE